VNIKNLNDNKMETLKFLHIKYPNNTSLIHVVRKFNTMCPRAYASFYGNFFEFSPSKV
jgi:hypothetical protein